MDIRFVGCGDAFGWGSRFNSCFLVERGDASLLIECGASSMIALRQQDIDPNAIATIFVSHLHGDHFGGLLFFILDAQFYSRRRTPISRRTPWVRHTPAPGDRDLLSRLGRRRARL